MARRRQRGSIRERVSKTGVRTWQVRVELPPHRETGERQTRTDGFPDYDAAERARTKWLAEIDEGLAVKETSLTLAALAERWLDEEAALRVRLKTIEGYRDIVTRHIIKAKLGRRPAAALTPSDVASFRTALVRDSGARTAELSLQLLKQMLAWGVDVELLRRNVAAGVKLPRVTREERQALSGEEIARLLASAAGDPYSPLWQLFLATGFRRGEALGLRWRDMDERAGTLAVRQTVVSLSGKPVIQKPKSAAARRVIDVDRRTLELLATHREQQHARKRQRPMWVEHDLIFTTGDGAPMAPGNVSRQFQTLCRAARITGRTVHDLRHTHATHLLLSGVPVSVVSRRLGHSKTSITLDIYGHLLPEYQGLAIEAIERALYPAEIEENSGLRGHARGHGEAEADDELGRAAKILMNPRVFAGAALPAGETAT